MKEQPTSPFDLGLQATRPLSIVIPNGVKIVTMLVSKQKNVAGEAHLARYKNHSLALRV